uniref:Uncharacterized protein n=1 Tax=Trypanosoma congolense (strain IL3000) TaxID=1068625 RepID=G0V2V7_TRYCI|nr:hypothetical protein, unlikely [Trypanosoma congolense IL3000]
MRSGAVTRMLLDGYVYYNIHDQCTYTCRDVVLTTSNVILLLLLSLAAYGFLLLSCIAWIQSDSVDIVAEWLRYLFLFLKQPFVLYFFSLVPLQHSRVSWLLYLPGWLYIYIYISTFLPCIQRLLVTK